MTPGLALGLPSAAKTVQVKDGKPQVKNGPYLTEGVGGYLVFEADSIEAAAAMAARIPAARLGGAVEVGRPRRIGRDQRIDENDWLAERFEQNRAHLRAVAYRMLGSVRVAP